jgi:hypothetical protein
MTLMQDIFFLCVIAALIYFIPTLVGFMRGHPNRWVIFLLNFVFGVTILGWFGCLIWASNAIQKRDGPGSAGGESGLNLFANDEKLVRIVNQAPVIKADDPAIAAVPRQNDIAEQLTALARLRADGVINEQEFSALKLKIIN